ncbi:MAG: hypothetical protein KH452_09190 [Clostridiales bacterium]|nr:hypothetical protein [Clostridiales bacterium]
MDKYEYRLKAEQIEKLVKKQDYKTAAKIADMIDWRRVKNLNMLYIVSEIYEQMERYEDCMEILNIAYDRAPVGRMLLYKMTDIATRMHNFEEAISLYREFVKVAPHDQSRYILKYQIYRERGSSLEDQIRILSEYKTHEYQEKWAYELAALYAQAGMQEECVRECDELILWFSEGEYVTKALELKMEYEPLTAAQQAKYDLRLEKPGMPRIHEDDFDDTEVPEYNEGKFSTINLQAELAESLGELLKEEAAIDIPSLEVEVPPAEPEELSVPEIQLEELSVPEIQLEELSIPEVQLEELPVEELSIPEVQLEELPVEELSVPEIQLEELSIPEVQLEELPVEELSVPEIQLEELSIPEVQLEEEPIEEEPSAEPEIPVEEVEKQITGQLTIDEILSEWEDKKAKTQAILEANAEKEQVRKEKVKQETAELMKLISGASDGIPKDVQEILTEMDEEKKVREVPVVTEDDLPQDLDMEEEPEEEEDEISFEDLDAPEVPAPVPVKQEKLSRDTMSMNMIQELERSLAAEVSELAVNSGHLTKDQARLFAYFTSVKGMSQQLSVLLKGKTGSGKTNSSSGNLVVTGRQGNGKTTLAIDIVKALQKENRIEGRKLAKITGQKLSTKDIHETLSKLKGGALIIESAGGLSSAAMMALSLAMEGDTGGLLVILEDSAEEIQRLFLKNKNFASKFAYTIDIPVFTNDELVAFGKSYAMEQEYVFDEFGILALYDRIGSRQTNTHLVTVAEVKDIIDGAIAHAEKGSIRHMFEKITRKGMDEFGNHLLREEDFED